MFCKRVSVHGLKFEEKDGMKFCKEFMKMGYIRYLNVLLELMGRERGLWKKDTLTFCKRII
jgi:hypothetical protein